MSVQLENYRSELLDALRAGDGAAARAVVGRMRADHIAPTDIYLGVLTPCMVAIGELWERNQLSVAEEHLATAITDRLISDLSASFEYPAASEPVGTALIGSVEGERHILGARMLADLLRRHGWRVLELGADVPSHDWVRLAIRFHADLVAISVMMLEHLPTARMLTAELRAADPDIYVLVGGAALDQSPDLWRALGASHYDPNPLVAVEQATACAASRAKSRKEAAAE